MFHKEIISKSRSYKPIDSLVKVSDLIADYLAFIGVSDVFVLTGGCAVHMIDSFAKSEKISVVPMQHEQSAAMAADSYSRLKNQLGVVVATSGPGATNLLTGVCCSYYDSVPTLILTGQVPSGQLKKESQSRQVGFQETDVVSIFSSVTKYSVIIENPELILYELDKAIWKCLSERMGPCLLDICDDVQRAEINPSLVLRYLEKAPASSEPPEFDKGMIARQVKSLAKSFTRPLLVFGAGVRHSDSIIQAEELIFTTNIPFTLTWGAFDFFSHDNPLFVGTFGVTSGRAGNFVVQNADLLICIGTRLDTHEIGNNSQLFAPDAYKIFIDIDQSEVEKFKNSALNIDLPIIADCKSFIEWALEEKVLNNFTPSRDWKEYISEISQAFNSYTEEDRLQDKRVNPYYFMESLSELIFSNSIIVTDCGSNLIWTMQGIRITEKIQRVISAWNHSPMGYSLPAAIGAAFANPKANIICITGDGGLQINVQELATIERFNLPIKIFVMNNHGHGIIQGTQDQWLGGRHIASAYSGGLPDPDYSKVTMAYGIPTTALKDHTELKKIISDVLNSTGPHACIVDMNEGSQIYPKVLAGKAIHEASPLLSESELRKYMKYVPNSSKLRR